MERSRPLLLVTPWACRDLTRFEGLGDYVELCRLNVPDLTQTDWDSADRVVGLWINFDSRVSEGVLERFPHLKFIATSSTGINHIDLDGVESRGISLVRLDPDDPSVQLITSTVELTWALVLEQFAKVSLAHSSVLRGEWNRQTHERSRQLSSQTFGVIGFGRVGSRVASIASAFGMEVVVSEIDEKKRDFVRLQGWRPMSLEDLCLHSDWVSIHASAGENCNPLVTRDLLEKVTPFHLINTSRGSLVDELAVVEGLRSGVLLSYSADVLSFETGDDQHMESSPVWREAQVDQRIVLSPHIGGATVEAYEIAEAQIYRDILRFLGEIEATSENS